MSSSNDRRRRILLRRGVEGVRDPWVLLGSGVGAGVAWAVDIPLPGAALVGGAMLAAAGTWSALRDRSGEPDGRRSQRVELRRGTEQQRLVAALDGYLGDLRRMHGSSLPSEVTTSAIEALVAADGARAVAVQVAQAIDGLDDAIDRGRDVAAARGAQQAVSASVNRMVGRRDKLLGKLNANVDEVAEVYTRLLELSATAATLGLGESGTAEVEAVNESLESLTTAFAELGGEITSDRRPPEAR